MSKHDWDKTDTTGYFMSEDSQFRLKKLHEHMVFLSHLAQPRTYDEDPRDGPEISGNELAICMELLAEQAELVLDTLTWPAQRKVGGAPAEVVSGQEDDEEEDAEDFAFGVTPAQMDALNRLVDTLSAHGGGMPGSSEAASSDSTPSPVGHLIHEGLDALREILAQVQTQHLGRRVGETRAVYGSVPVLPIVPGVPLGQLSSLSAYSEGRVAHPPGTRWH